MKKSKLLELPRPSSAVIDGPHLCTEGADLRLAMDFDDDGRIVSSVVSFVRQRAFRKRSEAYCAAWHVAGTFDTVCEVQDSDWVKELRRDSTLAGRDPWVMRHFIIYVDSFGCLEVVAESVGLDVGVKNSGGTWSVNQTPLSA